MKLRWPNASEWTAAFTGLLILCTIFEVHISHTTSEIQRNSERAFVSFSGPTVGAKIIAGQTPTIGAAWTGQEIALNWSNNGETPARNAIIELGANAFSPDIPAEFEFPLEIKLNAVIGAKATYGSNIQAPKDAIVDAWHGKRRLFVWGSAIYDDVFDNSPRRLSEFCVELTHLTFGALSSTPQIGSDGKAQIIGPQDHAGIDPDDPRVNLVGFQWQQCRAHNCYDNDCPDYKQRVTDTNK